MRLGLGRPTRESTRPHQDHRAARDLLLRRPPRGIAAAELSGQASAKAISRWRAASRSTLASWRAAGPGAAGLRQDLHRCAHDRRAGPPRSPRRHHRYQPQGDPQPASTPWWWPPLTTVQPSAAACRRRRTTTSVSTGRITVIAENSEVKSSTRSGQLQCRRRYVVDVVRGRTFANSVDVLVIDEAGQVSLANALAVAQAARSLILLGDPQQLEQPTKAAHPDGSDVSALEHLLGGHATIPPDRGLVPRPTPGACIPAITAFTSEQFYEGRLESVRRPRKPFA